MKRVLNLRPSRATRLALGVLEPRERPEEEPVVHLLAEDAPDRGEALGDTEPVRLEGDVEVEEVAACPAVEDRVELRREETRHVQALVLDKGEELVDS